MKTMKYLGCLLALVFAGASAFAQQDWFTAASAGALVATYGTWTGDASYEAGGHFKNWEVPLKFTATNAKSSSSADATITTTVKFTAMDIEDLPQTVETDVKGGLTVVEDATQTPADVSYYGIVNNGGVKSWQKLTGAVPDLDNAVEVKVILETVNNVSTIKYMIGTAELTCASGFDFSVASGTTIQSVEYLGECWLTSLASVFWDNPCTLTLTVPANAYVYVNDATEPLSGNTVSVPRHGGASFKLAAMSGYSLTGSMIAPLSNIDDSQDVDLSTSVEVAKIPTVQEAGGDVPTAITVDAMEIAARKESGAQEGTLGYLYTEQANGKMGWVNYSLGIDDDAKIAPTNGPAVAGKANINFGVQVDPSANVSYVIGNDTENPAASPAIDLRTKAENKGIVKVDMVLTDEAGTKHVISSVDVGVLETGKDVNPETPGTTYDIVAVPWTAFDGDDITVANLLNTAMLKNGDVLYVQKDTNGDAVEYDQYTLNEGAWGSAVGTTAAADRKLEKGTAIWIERSNASRIVFMGAPKEETSAPVAYADAGKWTLIANPSIKSFTIDADGALASAVVGDKIIVEGVADPRQYELTSAGWGYNKIVKDQTTGRTRRQWVTDDNEIGAGIGFWYVSTGENDVAITFPVND